MRRRAVPGAPGVEQARELRGRVVVRERRVEDQAQLGRLARVEDRVLEREQAHVRMAQLLASSAVARHLVALPRLAALGAGPAQRLDQLLERRVTEVARAV